MENSFILKMVNVFTKMFVLFQCRAFLSFFEEEEKKYLKKKHYSALKKMQHCFKLKEFYI